MLDDREKLEVLIEECAEVIHAASKCLRFGWDRDEPGYGINSVVLSKEIGDVLGMIDSLPLHGPSVNAARETKIERVEYAKMKRNFGG